MTVYLKTRKEKGIIKTANSFHKKKQFNDDDTLPSHYFVMGGIFPFHGFQVSGSVTESDGT